MTTIKERASARTNDRAEEVGQQAVYTLLDLLHSAQETARLLPKQPAEIRVKIMEALAISEIAVLRFKMDLPLESDDEVH